MSQVTGLPSGVKRFWHGGFPGLKPGTLLLGRNEAVAAGVDLAGYDMQPGYDLGVTRADRVYFSHLREFARGFAGGTEFRDSETGMVVRNGSLYLVEPEGEIEQDPDFAPGVSWCAPRARILSVEEENVSLSAYAVGERIGPYTTWVDGSPIYSVAGNYLPSPEQQEAMPSHPLFAAAPAWTPVHFLNAWLTGGASGDRPDPSQHPAVLVAGQEAGFVLHRHHRRAVALLSQGVEFEQPGDGRNQEINALLSGTGYRVKTRDDRGIAVAVDAADRLIGVILFEAMMYRTELAMFVRTIVVTESWRRRGLGSVLLRTVEKVLPRPPALVAGPCQPELAPFFAQMGMTVLRPGCLLPLPQAMVKQPTSYDLSSDECWFFRQGPA